MATKKPTSQVALALLFTIVLSGLAAGGTKASSVASGPQVVSTTLSATPHPWTYGWPIKPFGRQHPVRAFLNDPRIGSHGGRAFHFGIDIAAPDGTPVYAVEAGTVYFDSPVAIAVVARDRSHSFGYWHIVPAVKSHQWVTCHQLLGWIGKGWEHVHFAERRNGVYVNPLRPGGIGPYVDSTAPTISAITVSGGAVVVQAYDTPSPAVPGEWNGEPVTPALLRWRVSGSSVWHTIADFRSVMLPAPQFDRIYTADTLQNHKGVPGRFCFCLARGEQAKAIGSGETAIEVSASDTAGNRTVVAWLNV